MTIRDEGRKLVKLAWPLLIAQLTQTAMGVVDTIMAGRVSATDMAAVAIAASLFFPILFFIQGIILALPPIVSRHHGASDHGKIANATQQIAWVGMFIALLALLFQEGIFSLLGLFDMDPQMRGITAQYLYYVLFSLPAFVLYQVFRNFCEALGETKPSMLIMALGLAVNIPANYVFIYGKFGMPAMGGAGCGLATAIVFAVMMLATGAYSLLSRKLSRYQLFKHLYKPDLDMMWSSFKLGFPIAMSILFEVTLFAVVALLISPLGPQVVAAHQVALNLSSLMFMVPLSIGMATTIRVGHNLGQRSPVLAAAATNSAFLFGLAAAAFTACMSYFFRYEIAALYTEDPDVIQMAASLMLLAALFQFSDALQVVAAGALRGYKDTKSLFYVTLIAYWGIGLSVGYVLALTDVILPALGAKGFWIGFIAGLTSAAIMLLWQLSGHLNWRKPQR